MISFNQLGNFGRLGNQMFQYSSLLGIANYHSYQISIPPPEVFGVNDALVRNSKSSIYDCFEVKSDYFGIQNLPTMHERSFQFDQKLFETCPDNVNLHGYFQTEKYFKHIKGELKNVFLFHDEIKKKCKKYLPELKDKISLHVRRTDYLGIQNVLPVCPIEYYSKALDILESKNKICFVFSDDLNWCREQPLFQKDNIIFVDKDVYVCLYLMTLCDYHILANSSLSWWGAWLSNSKQVIAPKNWFANGIHNTTDLYCKEWYQL